MRGDYKILKLRIDTKLLGRLNKISQELIIPLPEFIILRFMDVAEEFEEAEGNAFSKDEGNQLDL